ncbi:COMM domain-containing protein 7 [Chelonia mydas]|uniref:COMM domain-containing protein 7 n=1 Tax=Chelonia mydas TaxID=8469 RepID=M7B5L2_CHEMY|nr:COMM domain-containing protein 7 [Chelonia mydas]
MSRGRQPPASGSRDRLNLRTWQQFSALTDVVFSFLTEPKEVERFLTQLSEFATMNEISLGPLKNIIKSILLIPNGALKRNLSSEQVQADFIALGLSEEKASYFAEQWKLNSPTLTRLAVGQTLMINQLIDMEWKFGVTAGSSELEKVGSIFLQLKLVVKKGSQTDHVYVAQRPKLSFESFLSDKGFDRNTGLARQDLNRVRTIQEPVSNSALQLAAPAEEIKDPEFPVTDSDQTIVMPEYKGQSIVNHLKEPVPFSDAITCLNAAWADSGG